MKHFEIIIVVFGLLITLLALADKAKLPYPALLVVAGLLVGFIPSLPALDLNPDIVFLIFLPPILYDAASNTSWHDFKSEIRPISTLAITLVFLTTTTVAAASHFLIPSFTWPMAFVLGAIVSPPDAVAATNITKGLGLNKRVITILQGESLVNDASALIAYRFAIIAISTGTFAFLQAGIDFLIDVVGGVLIGIAIGYLFIRIHKKILNNSILSTSFTLLTPYIAYLLGEHLHTSGVLAIVSTGLVISFQAPEIFSYQTRIRNRAVWDTVIFLLNGFIFILIGLQLPAILGDLGEYSMSKLIAYGLLVSGVTIAIRIIWVFGAAYSPFAKSRNKNSEQNSEDRDTWKNVLIVAWTGTRGVVSLATALALPLTLRNGNLFHQRSLILFLTFVVIFVTLVIQGLSLPLLIRLLGVRPRQTNEEDELRLLMASNVLSFIDTEFPDTKDEKLKIQIRKGYAEITLLLSKKIKTTAKHFPESSIAIVPPIVFLQKEINRFQRQLLVDFHKEGKFNQSIIRILEQELDHEELQLNYQDKEEGIEII